jgi:predicted NAD/FAD-binding protein
MRVAIVGTGISGLVAAWLLHEDHDIVVYEAEDRVGGHTHTVSVEHEGRRFRVDTGFIVFNEPNYPNFRRILDRLGVEAQPSDMSFSVRCERTGLEYCGTSLNTLFAQRSNLLRPGFHRMILDILRFNRDAKEFLARGGDESISLDEFLRSRGYSTRLVEHYVVPMGSALWSARPEELRRFPARYFLEFFDNHCMLNVEDRPPWFVVRGGSSRYVEAMIRPFRDRIRLAAPVRSVKRLPEGVEVRAEGYSPERFDRVILATHSDQALGMLADPDEDERRILGAIPYQANDVVLHTDSSLLPRRRLARAAWNYHLGSDPTDRATITYWMNRLQSLDAPVDFCVTLNRTDRIDPDRILRRFTYHHPVYTPEAVAAQRERNRIDGRRGTFYCGAYWGFGFHEDGVRSALAVCARFGKEIAA